MKKIVLLFLVVLASSCTMQKTRYSKGYYFDWFSTSTVEKQNTNDRNPEEVEDKQQSKNQSGLKSKRSRGFAFNQVGKHKLNAPNQIDYLEVAEEMPAVTADIPVTHIEPQTEIQSATAETKAVSSAKSKRNKKNGNKLLLFTALGALFASFGLIKAGKRAVNRVTRWASKNQKLAMSALAIIQLTLMASAVSAGYNLHQLGYEISDWVSTLGSGVLLTSFFLVPFLPKKGAFHSIGKQGRKRFAYILTAVSSMMMLTGIGNHVDQRFDNTIFQQAVHSVDNTVYGDSESIAFDEAAKEERVAKAQYITAGQVFLLILLGVLACAGICGIVIGFILILEGDFFGLALIAGGIGLTVAVINGMRQILSSSR